VLLALAGHDINVDTADTERVYRETLDPGRALIVKRYPDAAHSLVKQSIDRSDLATTLTALFSPRSLFAEGYLDDQRRFLSGLDHGTGVLLSGRTHHWGDRGRTGVQCPCD
jgi:hypothetical protein